MDWLWPAAALAAGLLALRALNPEGAPGARALACGVGAGLACAAAVGFLVLAARMGSVSDALAWFSLRPAECSFAAGAAGFAAGAARGSRDRAALPGSALALLTGFLRLSEWALEPAGLGAGTEGTILAGFPLSVPDGYGAPRLAVFLAEAGFAFFCFALERRREAAGRGSLRNCAAVLAAAQLFFENLRSATLMIGFVRTEQAVCALILLALAGGRRDGSRRMILLIIVFAACGLLQFMMDKPYLAAEAFAGTEEAYVRITECLPAACHALTILLAAAAAKLAGGERRRGRDAV